MRGSPCGASSSCRASSNGRAPSSARLPRGGEKAWNVRRGAARRKPMEANVELEKQTPRSDGVPQPEKKESLIVGERITSLDSGWDTLLFGGIPRQVEEEWWI